MTKEVKATALKEAAAKAAAWGKDSPEFAALRTVAKQHITETPKAEGRRTCAADILRAFYSDKRSPAYNSPLLVMALLKKERDYLEDLGLYRGGEYRTQVAYGHMRRAAEDYETHPILELLTTAKEQDNDLSLSLAEYIAEDGSEDEYLCDAIYRVTAGECPVTYFDLNNWLYQEDKSWDYFEDAIAEGYIDTSDFSMPRAIQAAWCKWAEDEIDEGAAYYTAALMLMKELDYIEIADEFDAGEVCHDFVKYLQNNCETIGEFRAEVARRVQEIEAARHDFY